MPFVSEAQKRKFQQLVKEGKMSQATYNEWDSATTTKIPERVEKPSKGWKDSKSVAKPKPAWKK